MELSRTAFWVHVELTRVIWVQCAWTLASAVSVVLGGAGKRCIECSPTLQYNLIISPHVLCEREWASGRSGEREWYSRGTKPNETKGPTLYCPWYCHSLRGVQFRLGYSSDHWVCVRVCMC